MNRTEAAITQLEERFVAWARTRSDIRAAFVVGSRAREDHPADRWADLDIMMVATGPERYLSTTDWLGELASVWLTTLGQTVAGGPERFVLFEGGRAVDFVTIPTGRIKQMVRLLLILRRFPKLQRLMPRGARQELTIAADLFGRGFRVLLDKDGLAARLPLLRSHTSRPGAPTQAEFLDVIDKFWFFADRITRKLRRGELYVAATYHHDVVHGSLLPMIEWHSKATHGWDYDTWNGGHFLEEWADPRVVEGLRHMVAHRDAEDMGRALLATIDVFRWLAAETSERLGYPYPLSTDEQVSEWVKTSLSEDSRADAPDR
jgi:aminoglycoside 6-adenylyltransferase